VENITGNVAHYEAFLETLKSVSPLPIVFEPMDERQDGYCRYGERIGIREGMSETQTVCAVIHEIAHARLHDNESSESKPTTVKEVESESISYVVCQRYGIETSINSFGYIAEFGSRDMTELKSSLDTIRKESNSLISAIDERYEIACKERGIDLAVKEINEEITSTMSVNENTNTLEHQNYIKLNELFPQVVNSEYRYLRLESEIMEPLSLEWIGDNKLSVMHTYTMNGDLMYDPMIVLDVNREAQTATAVEFEQSMPPIYQRIDEDGIGQSVDGNGRERTVDNLQGQLNDFVSQWLKNISSDEYMPVKAHMVMGEDEVQITFDKSGNPILPEAEPPEQSDIIMPGSAIGYSEMNLYGYTAADMLPLTKTRAVEFFNQDLTVYLLYPDNTEAMVYDLSEIETHDGIFGVERDEWITTQEYKDLSGMATAYNTEAARESGLIHGKDDVFAIYQLKNITETRDYRFEGIDSLEEKGLAVERGNYVLAYTAPLSPAETLDGIYQRFNTDRPNDFTGHSLSVSDVIVIQRGGNVTSHYVDGFGFTELPAFLGVEKQTEIYSVEIPPLPIPDPEPSEIPKSEQPIYEYPVDYALEKGEIKAFHKSRELNVECGQAIDQAIIDCNYELYRYDLKSAARVVIAEFGVDRASWVLAANVNHHNWDGRLSRATKDWAREFDTPQPDVYLKTHLSVLDGFVDRFREAVREKPSLLDTLAKNEQKSKQQFSNVSEPGKEKTKKSNREEI